MARIRIYLDGTFEATAGKYSFATDKERRDRVKVLQGDLKIMDKVEKLRVDRERNKKTIATLKGPQKEKARAKDKEFLGKIKELKAKLTSPRHSSSKIIGGMIRQTLDTVVGGKTISQIAKESGVKTPRSKESRLTRSNKTGDPRRNPTRLKVLRQPKGTEKVHAPSTSKIQDTKLKAALERATSDMKTAAPRTVEFKEHAAKVKKIKEMIEQAKDGTVHSKADLAAVAPAARKPSTKKAAIPKK